MVRGVQTGHEAQSRDSANLFEPLERFEPLLRNQVAVDDGRREFAGQATGDRAKFRDDARTAARSLVRAALQIVRAPSV